MDLSSYSQSAEVAVSVAYGLIALSCFGAVYCLGEFVGRRCHRPGYQPKAAKPRNDIFDAVAAETVRRGRDAAARQFVSGCDRRGLPADIQTNKDPASLRLARVISDPQEYRATPEEVQKLLLAAFGELQTEAQKLRG